MGWARSRTAAIKFSWQNRLWLQKCCSLTFFFPCYWRFQRLYGKTHKWDRIDEETFPQDYTNQTLGSVTQGFQQNFESFQLRVRFYFFNALKNVFFEERNADDFLERKIWKWNEFGGLDNMAFPPNMKVKRDGCFGKFWFEVKHWCLGIIVSKWNDIDDLENIAFLHY